MMNMTGGGLVLVLGGGEVGPKRWQAKVMSPGWSKSHINEPVSDTGKVAGSEKVQYLYSGGLILLHLPTAAMHKASHLRLGSRMKRHQ